jgi:hypothetical protein
MRFRRPVDATRTHLRTAVESPSTGPTAASEAATVAPVHLLSVAPCLDVVDDDPFGVIRVRNGSER